MVASTVEVGRSRSPSTSKLVSLECTGDVNTMTGIEAMSGAVVPSVTVSVVAVAVMVAGELTLTGSNFLRGC